MKKTRQIFSGVRTKSVYLSYTITLLELLEWGWSIDISGDRHFSLNQFLSFVNVELFREGLANLLTRSDNRTYLMSRDNDFSNCKPTNNYLRRANRTVGTYLIVSRAVKVIESGSSPRYLFCFTRSYSVPVHCRSCLFRVLLPSSPTATLPAKKLKVERREKGVGQ